MASEQNMKPEQYYAIHQMAFRTAFDFLTQHFPPGQNSDWWGKTANDAGKAYLAAGEETLTFELLHGVIEYLEKEWKRRYPDGADN